ncbi:MAG: hypothetical protein IKJ41_03500 [Clostridia bacterium]|nr:hypothetical protein [Clostridia bacterium]
MTIINTLNDIEESNLDFRLKHYLNKRFRVLSQSLKTENLVCFGSIFVFDDVSDSSTLSDIGIHCQPSEIIFESVTKIHILHSREEYNILLGCVVLNNDYAVDIVCIEGIGNKELEANMISNIDREEIWFYPQGEQNEQHN